MDTQTRINNLERFLNIAAKSGYVNIVPILRELAQLNGLDPDEVIVNG